MTDNVPPPQDPQTPPPSPAAEPLAGQSPAVLEGDTKTFVMLAHGLGLLAPILAPLIIWLVKKEQLPGIEPQCKETLNFQITWAGAFFILAGLLGWIPFLGWCVTLPAGLIIYLAMLVFLILATIAASNGQPYKFPWKLDLIK